MTTQAEASVACPHRSTSAAGVIHRMSYFPSPPTKYAVSARLFSAAMDCRVASSSHDCSGHTAAGFPPKTREVNAST